MKFIWSYSSLRDFDNCEHKGYRRYIKKDIPFSTTPESEYGNQVHKALELRLSSRVRLPIEHSRYEHYIAPIEGKQCEQHYEWKLGIREDGSACDFFAPDVWGRGVIDVAMIEPPLAMLIDWKTGKVREDPEELEVQAVLLKAHRPAVTKIVGSYVWLKTNTLGSAHDVSDTVVKLANIREKVEIIKKNHKSSYWPKHENALCGWCPVMDCEFNKTQARQG